MKQITYLLIFIFFQTQLSFAQLSEKDCKKVSEEIESIFHSIKTNFEGVQPGEKDQIRAILAETLIPYMDFEAAVRFTLKRDFKKLKKIKPTDLKDQILKDYEHALQKFSLDTITNLLAKKGLGVLETLQEIKIDGCVNKNVILKAPELKVKLQVHEKKGVFKAKNITLSGKKIGGVSVHTGNLLNHHYKKAIKSKEYSYKDAYKAF